MSRGFFITFEGLDGSGKSTQLRKLAEWFRAPAFGALEKAPRGKEPVITRQPGGTALGDSLRAFLLDSRNSNLSPSAELGLMFVDRAQCIDEVIRPALAAGSVVLCDRFTDSTEAYQGGGRELGSQRVLDYHRVACEGLQPDLTLLLMPDFDASLARARRRNSRVARTTGRDENRFELLDTAFFRRVYDTYLQIAEREPLRVVVIDGDTGLEEIHRRIVSVVEKRLAARVVEQLAARDGS